MLNNDQVHCPGCRGTEPWHYGPSQNPLCPRCQTNHVQEPTDPLCGTCRAAMRLKEPQNAFGVRS